MRDFTVCLAFRRELCAGLEGSVQHVRAASRLDACHAGHDQLIHSYGADDIEPATVIVVAIFAGHLGFTTPDPETS